MPATVQPFLMFQGNAEAALNFYVSLFSDGEILYLRRYGAGQPGPEGSVYKASFRIGGEKILCIDSPIKHAFDFTPSISLFIECESEAQIRSLSDALKAGGAELMPLGTY